MSDDYDPLNAPVDAPAPLAKIIPIRNLSHSSMELLHSCPRLFQLYRLSIQDGELSNEDASKKETTFCFGHVVGEGIQLILQGWPMRLVLFKLFTSWYAPLDARDEKKNKSFSEAILAVELFAAKYTAGILLPNYELVILSDGTPAIELGFKIHLGEGFVFKGKIDAILKHKETGEIVVLEDKTSSQNSINPIQYQNSSQALGYGIVVDYLFPTHSSYKVIYLIFNTKSRDYEQFPFDKSFHQRAAWLQSLLLEKETIKLYENHVFPMRGENCINRFYQTCTYLNICQTSTEILLSGKIKTPRKEEVGEYQYEFNIEDLIRNQLEKLT
jgi:hypothetical protein